MCIRSVEASKRAPRIYNTPTEAAIQVTPLPSSHTLLSRLHTLILPHSSFSLALSQTFVDEVVVKGDPTSSAIPSQSLAPKQVRPKPCKKSCRRSILTNLDDCLAVFRVLPRAAGQAVWCMRPSPRGGPHQGPRRQYVPPSYSSHPLLSLAIYNHPGTSRQHPC